MARMIDADKRISEIKQLYCDGCDNYGGAKCRSCWVDDAMCLIDDAKTVDAVEVVRCKDCKFYELKCYSDGKKRMCCENNNAIWTDTPPDAFCSYGERKDGDGNG